MLAGCGTMSEGEHSKPLLNGTAIRFLREFAGAVRGLLLLSVPPVEQTDSEHFYHTCTVQQSTQGIQSRIARGTCLERKVRVGPVREQTGRGRRLSQLIRPFRPRFQYLFRHCAIWTSESGMRTHTGCCCGYSQYSMSCIVSRYSYVNQSQHVGYKEPCFAHTRCS